MSGPIFKFIKYYKFIIAAISNATYVIKQTFLPIFVSSCQQMIMCKKYFEQKNNCAMLKMY